MQEGLARYELSIGRSDVHRRGNQSERDRREVSRQWKPVRRAVAAGARERTAAALRRALAGRRSSSNGRGKRNEREAYVSGLPTDGVAAHNVAARRAQNFKTLRRRVCECHRGRGKIRLVRELRIRPTVQGGAVVLENAPGAILAMAGGFSYPLSQLNRVTQTQRQPGSALKPLTYLAALGNGLQPNTLVRDTPLTLPRSIGHAATLWRETIGRRRTMTAVQCRHDDAAARARKFKKPRHRAAARRRHRGPTRAQPRPHVRARHGSPLYVECVRLYPFVLGAQPLRLLDLAGFYAAIATEGAGRAPYHRVDRAGRPQGLSPKRTPSCRSKLADRPAFYQLKTMLQGVVARGTARSMADLAPYIAGKTGTSDKENDTWFIGFTNDVTVGVWVGYDNADGKRRTLGRGQTGSRVALPIFHTDSELGLGWRFCDEDRHERPVARSATPAGCRQIISTAVSAPARRAPAASPNISGPTSSRTRRGNTASSRRARQRRGRLRRQVFGRQRSQPNFDLFGGMFGRIFPPFESRRVPQRRGRSTLATHAPRRSRLPGLPPIPIRGVVVMKRSLAIISLAALAAALSAAQAQELRIRRGQTLVVWVHHRSSRMRWRSAISGRTNWSIREAG